MSVLAGIWNFDGEPVNRGLLYQFSAAAAEYGPDGEATFFNDHIGLLYRPFSTTAESRSEVQPHVSPSGDLVLWDGRLDNRDELIPQIRDDLNCDQTDVAIVAAAFSRWGTDCFAKFIGDWSLSIWNSREQELLLARDYIGVRHLFYYKKATKVLWSNYLAPLALCGDQFSVCDEWVAGYLAMHPDADLTPYCEIQSVPPGGFVRIRREKSSSRAYWAFDKRLRTRYQTDGEYQEQYRHLFRQAVTRRLRTSSPILADLSGGFDSSSIVCMADDIIAANGAATPKLDTFSFYDSLEPYDDDLPYLTKVEERRARTGFHIDLRGSGDFLVLDNPTFAPCPGFGSRRGIRVALTDLIKRGGYRVLLSGLNGDEINGQALDPRTQVAEYLMQLRLVAAAKELTAWSLLMRRRPWIQLLFQTLLQFMPPSMRAIWTERGRVDSWIDPEFARKHGMSARQLETVKGLTLARPSVRDAVQTIATISKNMTRSGPSVVEKRYPYLDQNLVEFLTTIPLEQLLRHGERRVLMKSALSDLLPKEVLNRKLKARVTRFHSVALDQHWNTIDALFSSPLLADLGYVLKEGIREALVALRNGQAPRQAVRLLDAVSLELWLRDAQHRGVIRLRDPVREAGATLAESRV